MEAKDVRAWRNGTKDKWMNGGRDMRKRSEMKMGNGEEENPEVGNKGERNELQDRRERRQ